MTMKLRGKTDFIVSTDPALDDNDPRLAADLQRFNKTGERNGLPVRPGQEPAVWQLMSLSEPHCAEHDLLRARVGVEETDKPPTYFEARDLVRRGLANVKNALDSDGRPLQLEFNDTSAGKYMKQESLTAIYDLFGKTAVLELGRRIWELNKLGPSSGRP